MYKENQELQNIWTRKIMRMFSCLHKARLVKVRA